MIRKYEQGDFSGMVSNGLTNSENLSEEAIKMYESYTLFDDGVKIIISYFEYAKDCYTCFLVVSNELKISHIKELKRFISSVTKSLEMKRLETLSLQCKILTRWHRFIGFELEGTKRNYINGKNFDMWGMIW